eukprot:jgi/Ulvmu1/9806/UM056_0046.1
MALRRALSSGAMQLNRCTWLGLGLEAGSPTAHTVAAGWASGETQSRFSASFSRPQHRHALSYHSAAFGYANGRFNVTDAKSSTSAARALAQPYRQCQTSAQPPAIPDEDWQLEYSGVVSSTVRTLKMVSIATATLSLMGSPLYIVATMDGQYTAAKIMAASGFTCFGLFTTGLLHWFVGPYVHKLWYHAPSEQVKVQMLNIFARPRELVFNIADVRHPEGISPLQTFEANGRTMFVDEATFENKELLEKLTPASPFDMDAGETDEKKDTDRGPTGPVNP